jgi:hypothetical protein
MPQPLCAAGFAPFSIRYLLQFDLLEQLPKLQVVSTAASKEAALDKALSKMQADWQGVEFRVVEYKDTGTYVVGGTDEVQVGLWTWEARQHPQLALRHHGIGLWLSSSCACSPKQESLHECSKPSNPCSGCADSQSCCPGIPSRHEQVHRLLLGAVHVCPCRSCWTTRSSRRRPCVPAPSSSPWRLQQSPGSSCCWQHRCVAPCRMYVGFW